MPNLMQRGADWLGTRLQAAAGRSVTLQLDGGEVELTGWVAQQVYEVEETEGFTRLVTSYDWSFKKDELLLNSQAATIHRGNQITETLNGEDITYQVIQLPQRPVMEWLDTSGTIVVVHTEKTGVE